MNRKDWNFQIWCRTATALIRFGPDRKAVSDELLGHMEDAYDAYIAKGMKPNEAEASVLESMGEATAIAPQLAAIHSPFWGYVLRASQILLIALLCLSILPVWNYLRDLQLQDAPNSRDFAIYDLASYGDDTGRTLLHLSQPDVSFSSDGNTFTLTDAALFTIDIEDGTAGASQLYVLLRQTSPLPWTEHAQYYWLYNPVGSRFLARDSLGNIYEGDLDNPHPDAHLMYFRHTQSSLFSCTYEFRINDFPVDAQWVDICYERDGRNFALRVDLSGGDSK